MKKPLLTGLCPRGKLRLIVMRSLICFCMLLLGISYSGASQQNKISTRLYDASLSRLFSEIERTTDYSFIYNPSEVDRIGKRDHIYIEAELKEVLDSSLSGTPFSYSIRDGHVIVSRNGTAQQPARPLTGRVVDPEGNPVIGAAVHIKGTFTGAATDASGVYTISVEPGQTVVFSIIGRITREIEFTGQESLNVVLEESIADIEDVVVTGYQRIEKRQLTSSVATVKTDDLQVIGATSIEQMLQGELAGVFVGNTSAAPGSSPKIRVRGTTTINGNADPLWVLDGVIMENSTPISVEELNSPDLMTMFNSAIGGINPSDIESITVLKDASATAIYGTRAANGVIVVTTKRGKRGGFNFSYQHTSSVSMRPTYGNFDLMDSQERILLSQQILDEGFSEFRPSVGLEHYVWQYSMGNLTREQMEARVNAAERLNTDWFKLLYRTAYTQTHTMSFSGGAEGWDYYVSFNYNDEQGADRQSDYRQFGGFAKANMELFRGINLGATMQVGRRERETYHSSVDPFTYATGTARTFGPYDGNGDLLYYRRNASRGYLFNIYNEQDNTHRGSTLNDIKAIFDLSAKLYRGLKYVGLFSYSVSNSTTNEWATERSTFVAVQRGYNFGEGTEEDVAESSLPFGGVFNETTYEYQNSLIRNGLEYKTTIIPGLSIDVIAGQEFRNTDYRGLTTQGWGYMHDRGNIFYDPSSGGDTGHIRRNTLNRSLPRRSYVSYYGVASAMFRDKYIVNANVRFDGSNLFGSNPKYRYLPLWSVSGKWIVSQEKFMGNVEAFDHLALRASYGLRGNIVDESSPQIIVEALPPNKFNDLLEMQVMQAPNPELKWENTSSLNLGIELGMFDNRLSMTVDYYLDDSRNLIAYKDVSSVSGFKSKYVNYADVRNYGLDVAIKGTVINRPDFSWTSYLNMNFVKNEVARSYITPQSKNLVKSIYTPGSVYEGHPVNGMFSYRFAGLNEIGLSTFYDSQGNIVDSRATNDLIEKIYNDIGNLKYEGTRDPRITGGLTNTFRYKNLTLSFLLSFGLDYAVRLPNVANSTKPGSDTNMNRSILGRWQKPGDEATKTIPRFSSGDRVYTDETIDTAEMFNMSDQTIVPGDYLRLRNLVIEYRLPTRICSATELGGRRLKGVSLKFQAQNLFTIADKRLKGYDPETVNYSVSGYGSLPLQRKFTLGLNINF